MNISVVICTYNGEDYIGEQLKSILDQSRRVDEIILLDDASSDGTVDLAEKILKDQDIPYQIIINSRNLGVSANFEKGIALASGEVVLTADQDDVWLENKVRMFEELFEKTPACMLAFSDGFVTNGNLEVIRDSIWEAAGFSKEKKELFQNKRYYSVLFSDNVVTGAAMGLRRQFALKCVPAPKGTLHDYWYALCAPFFGDICFLEDKCILYRQHNKNVMGIPKKSFVGKVKRWMQCISVLEKDWEIRAVRASALKQFVMHQQEDTYIIGKTDSDKADYKRQIIKWSEFCDWRRKNSDISRILAVFHIIGHALKGEYRQYVDKTGIVFQDVICCLLRFKGGKG